MARSRGNTALQLERIVRGHPPPQAITPRQREILKMVAMGQTNREIAASLHISVRTVEGHISKLRKKLQLATGGNHYIETVWGRGYVLRDPDDEHAAA